MLLSSPKVLSHDWDQSPLLLCRGNHWFDFCHCGFSVFWNIVWMESCRMSSFESGCFKLWQWHCAIMSARPWWRHLQGGCETLQNAAAFSWGQLPSAVNPPWSTFSLLENACLGLEAMWAVHRTTHYGVSVLCGWTESGSTCFGGVSEGHITSE